MNRPTTEPDEKTRDALLDVFHRSPLAIERGDGCYVFDAKGRRYLDCYGGHAVALLGYGHPRLCDALDRQARTLFFQSNLFELDVRRRAAERFVAFCPKGLTKVFFSNSGAEANENALRAAFLKTGRTTVVCVEGAFHGRTAAAAALTDGATWYGFPSTPFQVVRVPFDDRAALDAAVDASVAAILFEPVQGMAGARPFSKAFVETARELSTARGAVLIFDEVQCGMGRTGLPFAADVYGVTPDILTTAKGLGGGFPVGATVVSDAVATSLKKGDLGTTFGGGPLACALIEAVLDAIDSEGLLRRVARVSERLKSEARLGPVVDVQGMGYLLGLRTKIPAKAVVAALAERSVLAGGSADPNVVRLLPPLVFDDAHADELLFALSEIRG
jgi:acetylornithine/N-succinyldiaminopimelate aminotransferase